MPWTSLSCADQEPRRSPSCLQATPEAHDLALACLKCQRSAPPRPRPLTRIWPRPHTAQRLKKRIYGPLHHALAACRFTKAETLRDTPFLQAESGRLSAFTQDSSPDLPTSHTQSLATEAQTVLASGLLRPLVLGTPGSYSQLLLCPKISKTWVL